MEVWNWVRREVVLNMAVILIDEVKLALLLMKVVKIKSQNKSEKSAKGKRGLEVVR